jgi:hypothetical protein
VSRELSLGVQAQRLRAGVLGLATHTIPQVRQFLPTCKQVTAAKFVPPFGYQIVVIGDGRTAELIALMSGRWRPDWSFHVWGADSELHIDFPPSYVLAGSATVTLSQPEGQRRWRYPTNGYQAEWAHLADVAEGRAELAIAEGVRAVVLTRPYVIELTRLQKLATQAEAAQVVVAVDSPYACDQTWTSALPRVKETLAAAAVLDSVITVARTGPSEAGLDGALLDQLAVVRPLLAAADLGLAAYHSDRHYVLAGGVDGIAVTLTGIVAPLGDDGMRLDLIGVEQHWRAHFDAQGPARPTSVTLFDADGEHSSRPPYESGRRATWRALHEALENGTPAAYTIDDLIADLALARRFFGSTLQVR